MPSSKFPFLLRTLRKVKRKDETSTWAEDALYRTTLCTVFGSPYKMRQGPRTGLLQLSRRQTAGQKPQAQSYSFGIVFRRVRKTAKNYS